MARRRSSGLLWLREGPRARGFGTGSAGVGEERATTDESDRAASAIKSLPTKIAEQTVGPNRPATFSGPLLSLFPKPPTCYIIESLWEGSSILQKKKKKNGTGTGADGADFCGFTGSTFL